MENCDSYRQIIHNKGVVFHSYVKLPEGKYGKVKPEKQRIKPAKICPTWLSFQYVLISIRICILLHDSFLFETSSIVFLHLVLWRVILLLQFGRCLQRTSVRLCQTFKMKFSYVSANVMASTWVQAYKKHPNQRRTEHNWTNFRVFAENPKRNL